MGDRLRIGIVCYPTIGGSGIVATQLGQALCEQKYKIHYISHDMPQRLGQLKHHCVFHHIHVPLYPLFRFPPYTLALATELARLAQEVSLDVLHVHYAIPHSTSAVLANLMLEDKGLRRVPLVTTVHGTDTELVGLEPAYRLAVEFSLNHCDALTAVSKNLRQNTLEMFDCRVPIEVIYNFVDTKLFHPPENTRHPRDSAVWRIIQVSNFRPVKRVLDAIQVFESIAKCISCELVLVGDGPERKVAEERVARLGLSDSITFSGKVLCVEEFLRQADILLCTSQTESFGMSIAEGMASGLPVVAPRAGGIPEVVLDGTTGILTDPGDLDALAEALLRLMTAPEEAERLGRAGRERIEQLFSPGVVVPQYEALYDRLAGPGRPQESKR